MKDQTVAAAEAPVETAASSETANEPREARRGGRERNPNRGDRGARDSEKSQFLERVVTINRVSKVVKGGRRFSFTASRRRRRRQRHGRGRLRQGPRGPHRDLEGRRGGEEELLSACLASPRPSRTPCRERPLLALCCCVRLLPVPELSPVGPVRAVLECAGIHDVLSKFARLVEHDQHHPRNGRGSSAARRAARGRRTSRTRIRGCRPGAPRARGGSRGRGRCRKRRVRDGRAAQGHPDQVRHQREAEPA